MSEKDKTANRDPQYTAIEKYLKDHYQCDSILEYYPGDSIYTSIYYDCPEYDKLNKKKEILEKKLNEERNSANKYTSYSDKDNYLNAKHSSNAEFY